MNRRIVGYKPLHVALAQRGEDREAHLTAQYVQSMTSNIGIRVTTVSIILHFHSSLFVPYATEISTTTA